MSKLWFEQKPMSFQFMRLEAPYFNFYRKIPCLCFYPKYPKGNRWVEGLPEIRRARDWLNKVIAAIEYAEQEGEK